MPTTNSTGEADADEDEVVNTNRVVKTLRRSSTFTQLVHKISSLQIDVRTTKWIQAGDIIMLLLLDLAIGILFSMYLATYVPNMYESMGGMIEELGTFLPERLDWLSGAPAGLKMNAALSSRLRSFFSYNLGLWHKSIVILEPVLKFLLSAVIHSGFYAGFSVQVALIKDMVSLTTFHVYCLYIYATRLFNIELYALKSLGRLFFGRKWNPLRKRIDSVHLNQSEMFLSSLTFTIAVFLSPTIIIYYVVFLSLRVPILLVESFLKFVIHVINSTEIVTLMFVLFNSSMVPHDVYLHPVHTGEFRRDPDVPASSRFVEVPAVRFEIRTRPNYKMRLPNLGKYLKDIVVSIFKGEVIMH